MMKGKFAVVAFAALLGVSSTAMADNKDGDGKIEFFGNIIDAGCQIDTEASNLSVKLGDVAKTTFTAAGDTAATTKFALTLKDCPDTLNSKPVTIKYSGTPDTTDNDYLQLTQETGVAKGVAIQLLNSDASPLPLGSASTQTVTVASNKAELDFFARYIATAAASGIEAGKANGSVNFTMTYN